MRALLLVAAGVGLAMVAGCSRAEPSQAEALDPDLDRLLTDISQPTGVVSPLEGGLSAPKPAPAVGARSVAHPHADPAPAPRPRQPRSAPPKPEVAIVAAPAEETLEVPSVTVEETAEVAPSAEPRSEPEVNPTSWPDNPRMPGGVEPDPYPGEHGGGGRSPLPGGDIGMPGGGGIRIPGIGGVIIIRGGGSGADPCDIHDRHGRPGHGGVLRNPRLPVPGGRGLPGGIFRR